MIINAILPEAYGRYIDVCLYIGMEEGYPDRLDEKIVREWVPALCYNVFMSHRDETLMKDASMQEVVQGQISQSEADEMCYQEWSNALLSTPEAQARYVEIAEEHDLWLQLAEARLDVGLTQVDLANKMGISRVQVEEIEQCGYSCSLDMLRLYANALGKRLRVSLV